MSQIETNNPDFSLRIATPDDAGLALQFMQKLGAYQQMSDEITSTEARLERLLREKLGEAVFGTNKGETVSFMYFNQTSSAFTGRSGLFIDAVFVDESMRGHGLGKIMMEFLSKEALSRGAEFLEWGCLDWNSASIAFYQGLGSYCLDTMRIYRLSPDSLKEHAARF
ncbi:MAG: GNAT family N-acetyltransferase [Albidovulum sp.]